MKEGYTMSWTTACCHCNQYVTIKTDNIENIHAMSSIMIVQDHCSNSIDRVTYILATHTIFACMKITSTHTRT